MRGDRCRTIFTGWAAQVAAALVVAAPGGPAIAQAPTATLAIIGTGVQVNGAKASPGMVIRLQDAISTGPKSSARIDWTDGVHLYVAQGANLEPDCLGWLAGNHVGCGWYLIDANRANVQVFREQIGAPSPARFAVQVSPGPHLEIFVLSGSVVATTAVEQHQLSPGARISIQPPTSAYGTSHARFGSFSAEDKTAITAAFAPWKLSL